MLHPKLINRRILINGTLWELNWKIKWQVHMSKLVVSGGA
jgi:hypothetical protein